MSGLSQIIIGAFLLSLVHASIPNHWIPLVALSKSEKWNEKFTLGTTAIAGVSHTLSTIIIGIIVGFLGYKLSSSYSFVVGVIAPSLLIVLGTIYLALNIRANRHHHHHHHHSHDINLDEIKKKTTIGIITTLTISMFFSPCLEIEAYYFVASKLGWQGIITVSVIYTVITILGMLLLVWLGMKGVKKIKSHLLEHDEKAITGIILIILGLVGYFIK
jgi:nickel/cobalt transporter (NicO) family protein